MTGIIQQTDFQILDWIRTNLRTGWLDWLMPKITSLGNGGIFWILAAILLLLWKPHRRCGITLLAGLGWGGIICYLLKNLVGRARPCWINSGIDMLITVPGDYSFPSGHTCVSIAAAVILYRYDRRFGIPALLVAAAIAFSRMYVYVHFPTDVLTGAVLGLAAAVLAEKLVERMYRGWKQERDSR